MSRRSPFVIVLNEEQRRELEVLAAKRKAEARMVLRARVVLAAADGDDNVDIAWRFEIATNTVLKWRKRFFEEGMKGLTDRKRSGRPRGFPPLVIAEVKRLACELPATSGAPLSRWTSSELARELVERNVVEGISPSTVARILARDAIRPWRYRMWIFPRDPRFATKAAVALDLYARVFEGAALGEREFVICADEKTSIQARRSLPPQPAARQSQVDARRARVQTRWRHCLSGRVRRSPGQGDGTD